MKIICAGFPKTGTKSMAKALRELGYTVNDLWEHVDLHMDKFVDYMDGVKDSQELMEAYADVDALVDQPACTMWLTFFKAYPDAKVILMERESSEAWFTSYSKMYRYYIENHKVWYENYLPWLSSTQARFARLTQQCFIRATASRGQFWDDQSWSKECWIYQYEMHNAAVKQLVPPEQLLVFKVGEGWDRLCQFLDKPLPPANKPFPRENVGGQAGNVMDQLQQFKTKVKIGEEVRRSFTLAGTCLAAFIGFGVVAYMRPNIFNK